MTAKPEETSNPAVDEAEAIVEKAIGESGEETSEETVSLLQRVSKKHAALAAAAALATIALTVLVKRAGKDEEPVEDSDNS